MMRFDFPGRCGGGTLIFALVCFVLLGGAAAAQEQSGAAATAAEQQSEPASRAEVIRRERERKAADLKPEEVSKTESRLLRLQQGRVLEKLQSGFNGIGPAFGGLPTGEGIALGLQYLRPDLRRGRFTFRTSARASFALAQKYDLELSAPRLGAGRFLAGFVGEFTNYPRMDYYGQGPDTIKGGRSSFRREQFTVGGRVGVRLHPALTLTVFSGFEKINIGRGRRNSDGVISIEQAFDPAVTPGLADQTDFLRNSVTLRWDTRDNPGGPRRGLDYLARYTFFEDRNLGRHDFRRLDLEARNYFPFFHDRRVIALRIRAAYTFTRDDQTVPFYMQPYLGGPHDLRGFRAYRFFDNNHIVANAEYCWEVFTGLESAIFFDVGKVAPKRSQINFDDVEGSVGFGFRFNARNNVFLRIDFGFSHEGYQIWFSFTNPF